MAVPSSYDYNAFAGYIKNEVLRLVAEAMGWTYEAGADVSVAAAQVITLNGATTDNSPTITVDAIPTAIYEGNEITFTGHATTYHAVKDYPAGTTSIRVFPYVNGVIADNTVGSYVPQTKLTTHPVYRYITEEALVLLGYTDISEVSGTTNLRRLRMVARIEAWRAVMGNTVSDVNVEHAGESYNRMQVYFQAIEQIKIAQEEYNRFYEEIVPDSQTTPLYVSSQRTQVKAAW